MAQINKVNIQGTQYDIVDSRINTEKMTELLGVQANATAAIANTVTNANAYADNVGATARNVAATNLENAINNLIGKPSTDQTGTTYTVYGAQSGAAGVQSQLSGVQSALETKIGSLEDTINNLADGAQVTNLIDNVNRIKDELMSPEGEEAGMQGKTYLDKLDEIIDTKETVTSTSGATFLQSVVFGYEGATGADAEPGTLILTPTGAQVTVTSNRTFIAGKQEQQP